MRAVLQSEAAMCGPMCGRVTENYLAGWVVARAGLAHVREEWPLCLPRQKHGSSDKRCAPFRPHVS